MLILRTAQLARSIPVYYRSLWKAKGEQLNSKPKSLIKVVEMENYFRHRLKDASQQCSNIIKELSNQQIKENRAVAMLEDWLNPQSDSTRCIKPSDLIMLLVALQFSSSQKLKRYRKLALDHLLEIDIQELELEERSFKVMMDAMEEYMPLSNTHGRAASWKLILLRTAANAHSLSPSLLLRLIPYILVPTAQNFQYLRISNLLQAQLIPQIRNNTLKYKEIQEFLKMCYRYGFEKKEYAEQLLSYIVEPRKDMSIDHLINVYRYFPPFVQASDGLTYKSKILACILQLIVKNQQQITAKISQKQASTLSFAIVKHLFSEAMIGIEQQIDKEISYITQQSFKEAKTPILPNLFWKIYDQFAQTVNNNTITNHLIQTCYPQHYKPTQLPSISKKPHAETEMILQIDQILTELHIVFTKQKQIAGRYADFHLQNNIILQVDGSHHFSAREFQLNEDTLFRNAHFIFSGYRVICLNVYEYNLARPLPQLKALILSKLALIESKKAVMVY